MQVPKGHTLEVRDIVRGREAARSLLQAREPSKRLESCPTCALHDIASSSSVSERTARQSISSNDIQQLQQFFERA